MEPPSSNELHLHLQVVVFTDIIEEKAIEYNDFCHNHQPPIAFIKADIRGVFGSVFCDFGPEFSVFDVNGEEAQACIIASITNNNPAPRMGILLFSLNLKKV